MIQAQSRAVLLGIDLGAGSVKATLVDAANGRALATGSHPVTTSMPHAGWSEQDPNQWYQALARAVLQALAAASVSGEAVAAVAVSAGAHIPVLLDDHHTPIRPAILWNDQRAAAEAGELRLPPYGAMIERTSLNRPNPTWTLPMLKWLKRHEPDNAARVRRLCLAKDYLRWRLTDAWASDFSDAVGALLADAVTRDWSPQICALIDWPLNTLPPLAKPTDVAGQITARAAKDTGLKAGTPVVIGSNDTTVELFGVGVVEPGQAAIKLATAGVLSLVVDRPLVLAPISCYPHLMPGRYYLATGTNACATAQRWACDRLLDQPSAAALDALAAQAPPGSEGLVFHPYLQGERGPLWDPDLRADFIGVSARHGRAHFARAVYEGIAFSINHLLHDARDKGLAISAATLLGGGANSALWRQTVADVTGLPLSLPANADASFASALIAGIGVGAFSDYNDALERCVRITEVIEPVVKRRRLYRELFEIYCDAQQALAPLDRRLAELFRY